MALEDKLIEVAENIPKVYDAGKAEGKDKEWNLFWDALQNNGTRTVYSRVFQGGGWTKESFKPKYDMKPTNVYYMFAASQIEGDLVEILEDLGVELDFSQATADTNYMFSGAKFTRVGVIDTSSMGGIYQTFMSMYNLVTIDKLILKDDGSQSFISPFSGCWALENLTIEGKIGKAFVIGNSPKLTHDSLMSIINALYDYSGTSTTQTCTLGAQNLAKLTEAEIKMATDKGWSLS